MRRPSGFVVALAMVCGALVAAPALAEQKSQRFVTSPDVAAAQAAAKESQRQVVQKRLSGQNSPDSYGLECCQILHIPASAFSTVDGATAAGESDTGYLYASAFGGNYDFWAAVQLPTGAHIQFLDLYYNDTSVASDFFIDLRALSGGNLGLGGTGPPSGSSIVSVSSTDSTGYNYASALADYTVNNNPAYDANGAQLILRTFFLTTDGSQSFKGVDIWWNRTLTPAPGVATFPDVPTGDPGFQYVEALVASNITGGCGGGLYCPDNPVTRRQMAIFIAKALGLYWPF